MMIDRVGEGRFLQETAEKQLPWVFGQRAQCSKGRFFHQKSAKSEK